MLNTLRWALLVPVFIGVATAALFGGRMSAWALIPFVITAVVLSLIGALLIGVLIVTRQRLEQSTAATERVLETVAHVHYDLVQMRGAEVSHAAVSELAHGLLRSGALEEAAAGFVPRPLQFVARPLVKPIVWGPRRIVERASDKLIDEIPWDTLDTKAADLDASLEGGTALLEEIRAGYEAAHDKIEATVDTVVARSTTPLKLVVAISFVPLILLWLVGAAIT